MWRCELQIVAGLFICLILGVIAFKMSRAVKKYGVEGILFRIFQGCGDICYAPRWIKGSLEAFAYNDKFDREVDYQEWKKKHLLPCPECEPGDEFHTPWCKRWKE